MMSSSFVVNLCSGSRFRRRKFISAPPVVGYAVCIVVGTYLATRKRSLQSFAGGHCAESSHACLAKSRLGEFASNGCQPSRGKSTALPPRRVLPTVDLPPPFDRLATMVFPPVKKLPTRGGLELSQLGVGTWQWGNKLLWGYSESDDANLEKVFNTFVEGGATWFDTGDSYGTGELEGRAESLLGNFSQGAANGGGPEVLLATKLAAYPWRLTPESMVDAVRSSNGRLGRAVDIAQMHWSPRSYGFGFQEDALLEGLCRCYEQGLCRAVGLSNFGPVGLRKAARVFEDRGVPLALNQVQYSLLSSERETRIADVCKELGVKLVAYSPLCLGLLAGRYSIDGAERRLPKNGLRGFLFASLLSDPQVKHLLGLLREIADSRGKTIAQVALNFVLTEGGGCAIVGARDAAQAIENLGACGWALDTAEMDALQKAASKAPKTQRNPFFCD